MFGKIVAGFAHIGPAGQESIVNQDMTLSQVVDTLFKHRRQLEGYPELQALLVELVHVDCSITSQFLLEESLFGQIVEVWRNTGFDFVFEDKATYQKTFGATC